jgi:hypothetical protein
MMIVRTEAIAWKTIKISIIQHAKSILDSKDINNNSSSSSNISNNDTSIGHTDNINDSGSSIDNSSGGFKVYPAVLNFVAGTFGGIGGVLAGHPFDTIKVNKY